MSLRVMSWNIQDLSFASKIAPTANDPAQARFAYIVQSVVERNPAIFVGVEVETARPPVYVALGYVVTNTSGGPAVLAILGALQAAQPLPGHDWRVVPPLLSGALGRKEGVAVFFDNNQVNFRGPFQVDNDPSPGGPFQFARQIAGAGVAWLPPWANALPGTPPAGGVIGAGLNQNQLAGRPYFDSGVPGVPLLFPNVSYRSPFLTEFIEVNAPHRTIKVLGCHMPPRGHTTRAAAIANVPLIQEMYGAMAANEVRVICGDFNIDALSPADGALLRTLTTTNVPLTAGGTTRYELGNFAAPTMLKRVAHASTAGVMPYLGYTATRWDWLNQVYVAGDAYPDYDGIYVAYGTYPDDPPHGYVMNRVVGTPPIIPEVPQAMAMPMATIYGWPAVAVPPALSRDDVFRTMPNYGKIFGASDHQAVYCDV